MRNDVNVTGIATASETIENGNSTKGLVFGRSDEGYAVVDFTGTASEVVIPAVYNGLLVVAIGNKAFCRNQLTSVIIPDSVTSIGKLAFALTQLTSVTIPDGVTHIGFGAFGGNRLTSVTIPDSVTNIAWNAFADNQLSCVTIGDNVIYIGEEAFAWNKSLTKVTVPRSTHVAQNAFDPSVEIIRS